jgi:hypothetical protein
MKKTIAVEVEVCDHCQEKPVARDPYNDFIKCRWCGRLLCSTCRLGFHSLDRYRDDRMYSACPECRANKLNHYYELKTQAEELDKQCRAKHDEASAEYNRLCNEAKN